MLTSVYKNCLVGKKPQVVQEVETHQRSQTSGVLLCWCFLRENKKVDSMRLHDLQRKALTVYASAANSKISDLLGVSGWISEEDAAWNFITGILFDHKVVRTKTA